MNSQIDTNLNYNVLVLGGNSGRWNYKDSLHIGNYMNGIESWVYAFKGDYICSLEASSKDISKYDIIIANSNYNNKFFSHLIKLQKTRPSKTKWVTLLEGNASDYFKVSPLLSELFDNSDLINIINKFTLPFFQKLTTAKVEFIGIPYPVDSISKMSLPIEKRDKTIFLCPWLLSRQTEYLVAKEIGLNCYGYEKRISRKLKNIVSNFRNYGSNSPNHNFNKVQKIYNDQKLKVLKEVNLSDYFEVNRKSLLWLNLDDRFTWGRYVLDAAALQIPIITTKSTGHADELFPFTYLENEFELDKAIELGKRLVEDKEFYQKVATYPIGKMEHLKPEAMKAKLLKALDLA